MELRRNELQNTSFIIPLLDETAPGSYLTGITSVTLTRYITYLDGSTKTDVATPVTEYTITEVIPGIYEIVLIGTTWDFNSSFRIDWSKTAAIKIEATGAQDTSFLIKGRVDLESVDINNPSGDGINITVNGASNNGISISSLGSGGRAIFADSVDGAAVQFNGQNGEGMVIQGSGVGQKGLVVVSAQDDAAYLVGGGVASGLNIEGSGSGAGLKILGGSSDGDGIRIDAGGNGNGIEANSQGSGAGIRAYSPDGQGLQAVSDNSDGLRAFGASGSKDINAKEIDAINSNTVYTATNQADYKADVSSLSLEATSQQILSELSGIPTDAITLDTLVDGVTVRNIFELSMAMANGRYKINEPITGQITFYKRDNSTVLTVVSVTDDERVRL